MIFSARSAAVAVAFTVAVFGAISWVWERNGAARWGLPLSESASSSSVLWPVSQTDTLQTIADKSSILEASAAGNFELVHAHITAGKDVNLRGTDGQTALHEACWSSHPHIVRLLLASGADVSAIEAKDGDSALHWAVYKGQQEIVHMLLEAGAEVNVASTVHGHTPLDVAVEQEQEGHRSEIIQLLISKGARKADEMEGEGQNRRGGEL